MTVPRKVSLFDWFTFNFVFKSTATSSYFDTCFHIGFDLFSTTPPLQVFLHVIMVMMVLHHQHVLL